MLARRHPRRRGMTAVETTLVLGVFLMLLFGLFEYCRYLMVLHVTNNAARDAARYATVNVNCPSSQTATMKTAIITFANTRMGGVDRQIQGYQVAVYPVDSTGLAQTPPVVRSKTLSTATPLVYPDPFNSSDPLNPPWNSAVFTEKIAVTIKGTYKPLLPTFLLMPSSISINITALMGSEG
jgi:Flp pilus assembly protein TadG